MKRTALRIWFPLLGFMAPWLIVFGPLLVYAESPGWDGPGGQYYIAALVVVGMLARLYAPTRGVPLFAGLLLGTVSLLVLRSAPVASAVAYLAVVMSAALVGWWLGLAGRSVFTRVPGL